jgi:hypothetical protein
MEVDMEFNNITDKLVYKAMRALGDGIKGQKLSEIRQPEDLYAPTATDDELESYEKLWNYLIGIIETRWFYSTGKRKLLAHGGKGLLVTPLGMMNNILGKSYTIYEKHDLIYRISERLMISSFASFKIRHENDKSIDGLAKQYLAFMFSAFCFELSNQRKLQLRDHSALLREKSLNVTTEDEEGKGSEWMDLLESQPICNDQGIIIIDTKDEELPLVMCIDQTSLKQFYASLAVCLSEKQQRIMEMHMLHSIGELMLESTTKLSDYVTEVLDISHDAYYVQLTRIRAALVKHFRLEAGSKKQEN